MTSHLTIEGGGRGWMGCDVTPDNSVRGGEGVDGL